VYLTYYLYGDRRQRGQEFVRLNRLFESAGHRLAGRELPDYLPIILEVAALEPAAGSAVLWEQRVGLELLQAALHDAASPYADVVDALCFEVPALDEAGRELVRRLAAEGPPGEQVGLEPFAPPEVMPPEEAMQR
jgi:nitrate reductase delta subunit